MNKSDEGIRRFSNGIPAIGQLIYSLVSSMTSLRLRSLLFLGTGQN